MKKVRDFAGREGDSKFMKKAVRGRQEGRIETGLTPLYRLSMLETMLIKIIFIFCIENRLKGSKGDN